MRLDESKAPEVRVENQLVRFTHADPIDQEIVLSKLSGQRSGDYILIQLQVPRATILIDSRGRIIVHGTKRLQIARAAAKEVLLRMGRSDDGLSTEMGPVQASFQFYSGLTFDGLEDALYPAILERDSRLDCMRIQDRRHEMELLLWENGKAVALGATHANLVAMSAVYWRSKIAAAGLFVAATGGD